MPKMFSDFRPVAAAAAGTGAGVSTFAGADGAGVEAFFYCGFFSRFPITIAIMS